MPLSISRSPDFSNQFAFPLEVREIGIPLYWQFPGPTASFSARFYRFTETLRSVLARDIGLLFIHSPGSEELGNIPRREETRESG